MHLGRAIVWVGCRQQHAAGCGACPPSCLPSASTTFMACPLHGMHTPVCSASLPCPAVAGLLGVRQQLRLPPACSLDPGTLTEEQRAAAGIARLPSSLGEAIAAFEADDGALVAAGMVHGCAHVHWWCIANILFTQPGPHMLPFLAAPTSPFVQSFEAHWRRRSALRRCCTPSWRCAAPSGNTLARRRWRPRPPCCTPATELKKLKWRPDRCNGGCRAAAGGAGMHSHVIAK